MKKINFHLIYTIAIIYFAEGKSCPEQYKSHKTRCDAYYKCVSLPSKNHIWTIEKCERGLIFESNLKKCVLPGDDWECTIGDEKNQQQMKYITDDNNVFGVNSLKLTDIQRENMKNINENIEMKNNQDNLSQNILIDDSNGDVISITNDLDNSFEASGDGFTEDEIMEVKENNDENLNSLMQQQLQLPTVDPNLTNQLQRLSQLIDGLRKQYPNKNLNNELRPDQLNAFLANYNIKAGLDSVTENPSVKSTTSKTNHLNENSKTNVIIKNNHAKRYRYPFPFDKQYSNSQIVVNRPEGSVLFSLVAPELSSNENVTDFSSNGKYKSKSNYEHNDNVPRISEETLKTVLELSKQMITNQNVRQIIPGSSFYQPVIQPMYYPVPIPSYHHHTTHNYHNKDSLENHSKHHYKDHKTVNNQSPVQVSTNSEKGIVMQPARNPAVDSYGYNLSPFIDYPQFLQLPLQSQLSQQQQQHDYSSETGTFTTESTDTAQKFNYPAQVTISNYYTPHPHLDNSNANNLYKDHLYPTISPYDYHPNRPFNFNPTQHQLQPVYNQQNYPNFPPQNYNKNSYQTNSITTNLQKIQNSNNNFVMDNVGQQSAEFFDGNSNNNPTNANEKIVKNILTQKLDQTQQQHFMDDADDEPQQQQSSNNKRLVHLGGNNFINYDFYKTQLLPSLNNNAILGLSEPEIITCKIGIRQANASDCTKYYVCSKLDSQILTYSCPPYTAFNDETRICDAQTYSTCHPQAVIDRYTIEKNKNMQIEAMKALQNAKRVRDQALQAQNLANLIRIESENILKFNKTISRPPQSSSNLIDLTQINHQQDLQDQIQNLQLEQILMKTTTIKPVIINGVKRRKYFCKDGDKVADQLSILNYYVCFKNQHGVIKGHKMTCSTGLVFCAKSKMCTLPKNCIK